MPRRSDPQLIKQIGARVARIRHERGWSQESLAAKVGISPESVSRFENANHALSLTNLKRLSDALAISLGDLLDTDRPLPVPAQSADVGELLRAFDALDGPGRRVAVHLVQELAKNWPTAHGVMLAAEPATGRSLG